MLTAESDKNKKRERRKKKPIFHLTGILNHIYKYDNKTISQCRMKEDRYHEHYLFKVVTDWKTKH